MLTHLSESEAHFKSQQRGEPDLTIQEKYDIACEKLLKNPANFLSQFGQFIQQEHLIYFTQFEGQYEIDFHVREIHKQFNKSICAKTVNNRRYSAMQKLMEDGEYFSEEEMKYRDPLLYEEMIGQYLTDDEIQSRVDKTDLKFSSILLKHIDQIEENKLYYYQKNQQDEEEESELESEEETENKKPKISSEEQQELKTEYIQMMQEKFLTGQDHHFFDYSTVDKNSEYDSLPTIDQDEQDKYFDDDDFD
ncbi:hypothetical protein LOTGIDRAFT_179232 [Lottia gigantea]|uniref:CCD97-like C-terminal domain-containing protein n=1 Tax=Lottia gigantea TaxID=225164 RepID=V3ZYG7_LOTGI|nr:hypothetical protein LOTGIDRAFT_179232 [Lottia gigantea]ESO87685.1 hypothetical protein LOTGIDRAFT_179232 [Lottia gigantea]